jgi:hypothetical protein
VSALAQHAAKSRARARARGLADCIHYAPNACMRADALYAAANASVLPWWNGALVGLLSDGRMVLTSDVVSFFENNR